MRTNTLTRNTFIPFQPATSARTRFNYWMTVEDCLPVTLQLVPVLSPQGDVVDLICAVARGNVGHLLDHAAADPAGQRMSALLAGREGGYLILATYISVATTGEPRFCESRTDSGERVQHHVSRIRPKVIEAELRSKSAFERAKAAYVRLKSSPPPR